MPFIQLSWLNIKTGLPCGLTAGTGFCDCRKFLTEFYCKQLETDFLPTVFHYVPVSYERYCFKWHLSINFLQMDIEPRSLFWRLPFWRPTQTFSSRAQRRASWLPLFSTGERQKTRFNLLVIVNFHAAGSGYGSTTSAYLFLNQGRRGTGAAGDCEHPPGEWAGPGRPPARPLITAAQPGIFSNLHPCNWYFWASRIRDYFVDPGIEIFPPRSKKDCFLHYFDFWITWCL